MSPEIMKKSPYVQKLAGKTINGIVESITTPLKWAMKNQYIENITFYGLKRRNTKSEERAILLWIILAGLNIYAERLKRLDMKIQIILYSIHGDTSSVPECWTLSLISELLWH